MSFFDPLKPKLLCSQSSEDPRLWAVRLLLGSNSNMQLWTSHSGIWWPSHRSRSSDILQSKSQTVAQRGSEPFRLTLLLPQSQLALQISYFATACAIKTSLVLLYYRLFGVVRWFRSLLGVMWLVVLAYFIADTLVAIFECKPIGFYWDKTIKGGTCINQDAFYRWNGVANLLIDFSILILPMVMVWPLNLDLRSKITLSGVFLLGTV